MSAILLDNEFKILYLNTSALEVTKLSFSDAKGIDCSIYFPDINFCLANKSKSVETRYIDASGKTFDIVSKSNYISRDLSWLKFDERVLDQARNPNRTIFEKLKFFGNRFGLNFETWPAALTKS